MVDMILSYIKQINFVTLITVIILMILFKIVVFIINLFLEYILYGYENKEFITNERIKEIELKKLTKRKIKLLEEKRKIDDKIDWYNNARVGDNEKRK